jgi:DNA-binding XRE family transcriptional regulator
MNQVKKLRTKLKIPQSQLARLANIDLRYLQRIEAQEQTPTVYIAINLAKALHTTVEILFIHKL